MKHTDKYSLNAEREKKENRSCSKLSSVQSLSRVQLFATPWTAARQASLSITNSWSLLKLTSIESVMPSNHLILCHPLLLPPSIFPSIRVFSNESVLRISFSISPSSEYSGLISYRMDWLDLLAVSAPHQSPNYPVSRASRGNSSSGAAPLLTQLQPAPGTPTKHMATPPRDPV